MTIYYEMSIFLNEVKTTGISRVIKKLCESLKEVNKEIKLIGINDELKEFRELKKENESYLIREKVNFLTGDVIITADATWAYGDYNNKIKSLKKNGVKFIQVFYDLIPSIYPYFYEDYGFGEYYGKWLKEAFFLCDYAYSISASTKNDMTNYFGLNENQASKIKVIRCGGDFEIPTYTKEEISNYKNKFSTPKNFLLSVGTIEIRKNQIILLNAYRFLLKNFDIDLPKLYIVGKKGWLDFEIEYQINNDPLLKDYIKIFHETNDKELIWLYKNSLFTLYPSFYEGWGLPIVESLMQGTPCIASKTSSMKEVSPNFTLFASPYHLHDWVAAIYFLLDRNKLENLKEKIKLNFIEDKWIDCAESINTDLLRIIQNL